MKIFYLSSVRIPSEKASGLAIVRQCEAFQQNGHEVELFVPKRNEDEKQTIETIYGFSPIFKVRYFAAKAIYDFGKIGFFLMLMRDAVLLLRLYYKTAVKPDIIYSRDHRLLFVFVLFGLRNKCFVEMHTKHNDLLTRYVLRRVRKIIVISHGLDSLYSSLVQRDDIQIEPSGVYLEQFENLPDKNVSRRNLDLPEDKVIFSYIGKYRTMGEDKGVNEIIFAFADFVKKYPDTLLYLVGIDDGERELVVSVATKAGLQLDKNILIEKINQAKFAEYLNASDVLLMNYPKTEHYEKYMSPTKLFAYMATGKPIISSNIETVRLMSTEYNALFADSNSIEDYSQLMTYVIENMESMIEGEVQRKKIVEKYSWYKRALNVIK